MLALFFIVATRCRIFFSFFLLYVVVQLQTVMEGDMCQGSMQRTGGMSAKF